MPDQRRDKVDINDRLCDADAPNTLMRSARDIWKQPARRAEADDDLLPGVIADANRVAHFAVEMAVKAAIPGTSARLGVALADFASGVVCKRPPMSVTEELEREGLGRSIDLTAGQRLQPEWRNQCRVVTCTSCVDDAACVVVMQENARPPLTARTVAEAACEQTTIGGVAANCGMA